MADFKPDIVVVGSSVMDLICYTPRIPTPGETIVANDFQMGFGGKGANQCVAAARLGSKCAFVGKFGADYGNKYLDHLIKEGINVDHVKIEDSVSTGVASIIVGAEDGQNVCVSVFGANSLITPDFVREAEPLIASCKMVVVQLEISVESTFLALQLARKHSVRSIFNLAPGKKDLPKEILLMADIICLNETETELVTGLDKVDKTSALQSIEKLKQDMGYEGNSVIVTLGEEGVFLWDGEKRSYHYISAPKVAAVDCTGAGDCFVGTLAHVLTSQLNTGSHRLDLLCGVEQAVANASESVLHRGTQSSLPYTLIPINKM